MGLPTAVSLVLFWSTVWADPAAKKTPPRKSELERLLKESENLSLIQDRTQACALLVRALKGSGRTPEEIEIIQNKLNKLSRVFYTESGFQSYLAGKAFLNEFKAKEAADRFNEALEPEHGNLAVWESLAKAQLRNRNLGAAEKAVNSGIALNPYDVALLQLDLTLKLAKENWESAAETGQKLLGAKERSYQTLKDLGVALFKLGRKFEAERLFQEANQLEKEFPEPFYWLGAIKEGSESAMVGAESTAFFQKYLQKCLAISPDVPEKFLAARRKYDREMELCAKVDEVKKKVEK